MKRKKLLYLAALGVSLAVLLLAGIYFLNRNKRVEGIILKPQEVYSLPEIPYYLQNDSQWADDKLGQSIYTMKSSGCLTTSLAASLSAQGGQTITPKALNQLFSDHAVYNANGDIVWDKIQNAVGPVEVYVPRSPDADVIEAFVAEGTYPVVKVKYHGSGAWHWVVLIGSDEKGYLCMDSLNKAKSPEPLSVHGNKVYSMRMVRWEK